MAETKKLCAQIPLDLHGRVFAMRTLYRNALGIWGS